jgi:hypothetical protein
MSDMSDLTCCISCGAIAGTVVGRVEIEENDITALAQLFAGTYDFNHCGACGARQPTRPEISFNSERVPLIVRSIVTCSPPIAAHGKTGYRQVASADHLRRAIAEMMRPHRLLLHRMCMARTVPEFTNWVCSNWGEMTADLFRVAHLITKVLAPGYRTSVPDGLSYLLEPQVSEKSVKIWPVAQALAWGEAARWVCDTPSARLEATLDLFIAAGGVLPGTIDTMSKSLSSERSLFHYVANSFLASASAILSKENMQALNFTHVLDWVHLFSSSRSMWRPVY